jgi:hypothetical protein
MVEQPTDALDAGLILVISTFLGGVAATDQDHLA